MHQAVLMHANVHESPERGHVGHHAFQHHARGEVLQRLHALGEAGRGERRPWVTAGLLQLAEDVGHGRQAETVVGEVLGPQRAQHGRVADQPGHARPGRPQDAPDHRIGLRVDAGRVQRVVPAGDAQEPRALLERLRSQPRHGLEGLPAAERASLVPPGHDRGSQAFADPRHAGQQRDRRGVHVHADAVHAVLDDRVQRPGQLDLGQVVLVLANPDGLRVDLDQLG